MTALGPIRTRATCAGLLVCLLQLHAAALSQDPAQSRASGTSAPADSRLACPSDTQVDTAVTLIRAAYEAAYDDANKSGEPAPLIAQLVGLADQSADPVKRYALLFEAEAVASQHECYATALELLEKRASLYRLDRLKLRSKLLKRLSGPKLAVDLVLYDQASDTAEQAMRSERFEVAAETAALAVSVAKAIDRDQKAEARKRGRLAAHDGDDDPTTEPVGSELIKIASALHDRVTSGQRLFAAYGNALTRLESEPDDAAANTAVAKYLCFVRSDWQRGLPALAKSELAGLKKVAADEAALSADLKRDAKRLFVLAGAWWDASGSKGLTPGQRSAVKDHAATLYAECVDGLDDVLEKQLAKSRLKAVAPGVGQSTALAFSMLPTGKTHEMHTFGGHTYWFPTERTNQIEARLTAEKIGGTLVVIDSDAENRFVAQHVRGTSWIGIGKSPRGLIKLTGGEQATYFAWDRKGGQPSNTNGEVGVSTNNAGLWHDHYASDVLYFVVELPHAVPNVPAVPFSEQANPRLTAFEFTRPNELGKFITKGPAYETKHGLEFAGGSSAFADSRETFRFPLTATFVASTFSDRNFDCYAGVFSSPEDPTSFRHTGIHFHWGGFHNSRSLLYVFGKVTEIPHRSIVAGRENTISIRVDNDRRLAITVNGETIHDEVLPTDLRLEGSVRCGGGIGHVAYKSVAVEHLEALPPRDLLRNSIGIQMKLVPSGTFQMGSEAGEPNEKPVHEVQITRPIYLGVTEVTNAQWKAVMGSVPSKWTEDDRPVEQITWESAVRFCRQLSEMPAEKAAGRSYRLPTEAEWEYACRAGTSTQFCFGDDENRLVEYAWFGEGAAGKTHPVGRKKPNAWGFHDMHGNVWEWCLDGYREFTAAPVTQPDASHLISSGRRLLRGGSWWDDARFCRSSLRNTFIGTPVGNVGFRVALSVSGTGDASTIEKLPPSGTLTEFRSAIGRTFEFMVTGSLGRGAVWGSNPYTADSQLARAAVHAGALKPGQSGVVRVTILPGLQSYPSCVQNGITSGNWGSYHLAYRIETEALKHVQDPVIGRWRWFVNGVEQPGKVFLPHGEIKTVPDSKWVCLDPASRQYQFIWVNARFTDSMTLSPDGSRLIGRNNEGTPIEGKRDD